jgi:hypothetical protein
MATSEREVFAANLQRLIDNASLSKRQVADRAGVSYTTLCRWLDRGPRTDDPRSRKSVQRICRMLHVDPEELWTRNVPQGSRVYPDLVRQLYEHWETLGDDGEALSRLLDRWVAAVQVSEKFIEEEPDLAAVVAKVKKLRNDREVRLYLESMLREWELDEQAAYRRLIETTQRFLAAALPKEPEQLGGWFVELHPRRWKSLIKTHKLDNKAELIAYLRHIMDEGLSALEAYESILRMSKELPVISRRRRGMSDLV